MTEQQSRSLNGFAQTVGLTAQTTLTQGLAVTSTQARGVFLDLTGFGVVSATKRTEDQVFPLFLTIV